MRIAYLDCFAGIAGDMFLGALLDAGVPEQVLRDATAALGVGASLRIERVDRSGISATKVYVLEDGDIAERPATTLQQQREPAIYTQQPKTQHRHKTGHVHTHDVTHEDDPTSGDHTHESKSHPHSHGRSLAAIRTLIQAAPLPDAVKQMSVRAFELLGESEAKIHNVAIDEIHFHEVGAVDAIVDIVAACAGVHHLHVDRWYCSAINVGAGTVECAHGTFPVPAPATADLLRGFPTYSAHVQKELVTPTGAALLRVLDPVFEAQPAMRVEKIGYGAGMRNSANFPNVVRLSVGEAIDSSPTTGRQSTSSSAGQFEPDPTSGAGTGTVTVLETALDDISPQLLAYVAEAALAQGALDVMLTPVIMKKGRPGTLLTVLCEPPDAPAMERLILAETTTLGLRIRQDRRSCLERSHVSVGTDFGEVRVKVGARGGATMNVAPEFEDCRKAAARHSVPVKQVQQAAIAAYLEQCAAAGQTE